MMLLVLLLAAAAPIPGEAPCRRDKDCTVTIENGCCGCKSLQVKSKRKKPERPPECGCADYSYEYGMPGGSPHCGAPPPDPATFRAACVKKQCVAIPAK